MKSKYVILLDFTKGTVIRIKLTDEEQKEADHYEDFEKFLCTLEDRYQFSLTGCQFMLTDELNVRDIGFGTTEEEYAHEVLKNDVLKSDRLEDYYHQVLDKASEDDKRQMMTDFVIKHSEVGELIDELWLDHVRCCSVCGRAMTEGYCIENGISYYCSDECMHKEMTDEEYQELYDDGYGDSYWTSWSE